jgi:hypothetical protein
LRRAGSSCRESIEEGIMPKAIKRRVKSKNVENEVQDRITDIREMMQQKQKAVIMYGGAAALVIVAIAGLIFYRYSNEEKARQLEYEAYKIYHHEYQKTPLPRKEQAGINRRGYCSISQTAITRRGRTQRH